MCKLQTSDLQEYYTLYAMEIKSKQKQELKQLIVYSYGIVVTLSTHEINLVK